MHGSTELLAYARSRIERLSPTAAHAELSRDPRALLIDVRTASHRATGGHVPGAHCIDLTVLPWRLDPEFGWRIPEATSFDQRYILMCRHGFSTSLAAWQLGLMGGGHRRRIRGVVCRRPPRGPLPHIRGGRAGMKNGKSPEPYGPGLYALAPLVFTCGRCARP